MGRPTTLAGPGSPFRYACEYGYIYHGYIYREYGYIYREFHPPIKGGVNALTNGSRPGPSQASHPLFKPFLPIYASIYI